MKKIRYALIGSGWRAEFYIRIAKAVPEQFELAGVLIRDREKGDNFARQFQVSVVNTLEELQKLDADFVVLSVKRGITSEYLPALFERHIPVLCETPPAESMEELEQVWRDHKRLSGSVQIAEQYFLQPLYAAWLQAICQGKLGEVQNINLSALHGYHGVSMIRLLLKERFSNCSIYGKKYWFDVTETAGREGMVFDGSTFRCSRDRLTLEFEDGKIAFFDFSDPAQYHSFIRTRQMNVQGTRGEIDDLTIRYLTDGNIPVTQQLNRIDLGIYNNQEWSHLGIMLGEEFLYRSPFPNARLNDDEIAVASCLKGMAEYVQSGKEFYGLAEALQDMYISLKMEEAMKNPYQEVRTSQQIWAEGSITI